MSRYMHLTTHVHVHVYTHRLPIIDVHQSKLSNVTKIAQGNDKGKRDPSHCATCDIDIDSGTSLLKSILCI